MFPSNNVYATIIMLNVSDTTYNMAQIPVGAEFPCTLESVR